MNAVRPSRLASLAPQDEEGGRTPFVIPEAEFYPGLIQSARQCSWRAACLGGGLGLTMLTPMGPGSAAGMTEGGRLATVLILGVWQATFVIPEAGGYPGPIQSARQCWPRAASLEGGPGLTMLTPMGPGSTAGMTERGGLTTTVRILRCERGENRGTHRND
jgi:hypothetical protein